MTKSDKTPAVSSGAGKSSADRPTFISLGTRGVMLNGLEIGYLLDWIRDRATRQPDDVIANSLNKKLTVGSFAVGTAADLRSPNLVSTSVLINIMEGGYLLAFLWEEAKQDELARGVYLKIKNNAIAGGVDWYYGDPWDAGASPPKSMRSKTPRGRRNKA